MDALRANPQIEAAAIYDSAGKLFVGYRAATDIALPPTAAPQRAALRR